MSIRFCTSCQANRDEVGGEYRYLRKTARWVCQACVEHRTQSIYKSRQPASPEKVRKLMAQVYGRTT